MAMTMPLHRVLDATSAFADRRRPAMPVVPTTRVVRSLDAALRAIRELGGAITSETRTAPGVGSWAFVAAGDGSEIMLWEDAAPQA